MIDPEVHSWLALARGAGYALFAAVAGALGYLFRSMDAGVTVSFGRALIEAFGAGVVGLFAMWICQAMGLGQQWTAVTVGVSGWLGATASIQVLQRVVWQKLGIGQRTTFEDYPDYPVGGRRRGRRDEYRD